MIVKSFNVVAIISLKRNDYRIHFWCMSKDEAINIMKSFDLKEKEKWIIVKIYVSKMNNNNNSYHRNKERLQEQA